MFEKRHKVEEQADIILTEASKEALPEVLDLQIEHQQVQSAIPTHQAFDDLDHSAANRGGNPSISKGPVLQNTNQTKSYSDFSDTELTELVKHPNTSESDWLQSCMELNSRQLKRQKKNLNYRKSLTTAGFILLSLIATVAFFQFSPMSKVATLSISKESVEPYVLSSAQYRSDELMERACIRLAQAIDERAWSYSNAANYLHVSNLDVINLMNGANMPFSMQALNKLLFAMGESTVFPPTLDHKELQRTVTYFTRLIAIAPTNSRAIAGRAAAYENLQQFDLAIMDLRRLVELEPQRPGPRQNLAWVYQKDGRYDQSLQELDQLHDLFPNYDIYQNRALVFSALGKYKDAVADCTKSIKMMQTQRPGPYWNRALNYEELGKYAEAIADCKKVLEIDPTYVSALEKIANLKAKMQS